ncbi:MAG: hypothetical protein ABL930_06235, partial [Pseudobdellovibrio sp.]
KINFLGEVIIPYKGHEFNLMRLSAGNMSTGSGGSFPILWGFVKKPDKVLIANALARKYLYVFSFPKQTQISAVQGIDIAFLGQDLASSNWLKNSFLNSSEADEISLNMLARHLCYFRIKSSWMVKSFGISKRHIFQYYVLPESVYAQPETLKPFLDGILSLIKVSGNELDF